MKMKEFLMTAGAIALLFYFINPALAVDAGGKLWLAFGPLITSIGALVIIVLAFKVMFGGISGDGGGGKKKK